MAGEDAGRKIDGNTAAKGSGEIPIDRTAPAGSPTSLGAESVRDGRPSTDDSVIEAIDEMDHAIPDPSASD